MAWVIINSVCAGAMFTVCLAAFAERDYGWAAFFAERDYGWAAFFAFATAINAFAVWLNSLALGAA